MLRCLSLVVFLALVGAANAQSELAPSTTAVSGAATYAGVVSIEGSSTSLDRLRGPGAALDVTYGRFSVGGSVAVLENARPFSIALGFHLARDGEAQRVTTLSVAVQADERVDAFVPSLTHAQRVVGTPGLAIVPSAGLSIAIPYTSYTSLSAVGSGSVAFLMGGGPVRPTVVPSVAVARGEVNSVTVGASVGLTVDLGPR